MAYEAQGGNTEADDEATAAVGTLFAKAQPDTMVTKFIIIAVGIDEEGDEVISSFTSKGLKRWDSMGMLQFALSCENGNTVLDYPDDDVDDD